MPVHDIVNTGEETFRAGSGVSGFINVCLTRSQTSLKSSSPPSFILMNLTTRQSASQPWGFRLQGGKDRGLPFQLLKVSASANVDVVYLKYSILNTHQVPLDSIASHSGAKSGDYLVKIGGDCNFNPSNDKKKTFLWNVAFQAMTCSTWTMRRPKNWLGKKPLLSKR